LDKTGEGSIGSTLGQGRGKDQCSNRRNQIEAKDHTNPITRQGDTRAKEDAGRIYHCANTEIGASGSNRTITGMGSISTHTGRSS
jgi:hypothetical protein